MSATPGTMNRPATSTLEPEHRPLTAWDRCDAGTSMAGQHTSCGAQAFVRVVLPNGELLFCGHHFNKHSAALIGAGALVDNQLDRINDKPSPSASND